MIATAERTSSRWWRRWHRLAWDSDVLRVRAVMDAPTTVSTLAYRRLATRTQHVVQPDLSTAIAEDVPCHVTHESAVPTTNTILYWRQARSQGEWRGLMTPPPGAKWLLFRRLFER